MKEGDIALVPLPQADGQRKRRPAVILRFVPPLGDILVCGVSTQLQRLEASNSHFDTGRYPQIVWSPAFRRFFCSFRLKAGLQTCQNENGCLEA